MHHIIITNAHRCEFIRTGACPDGLAGREFILRDSWQQESASDYLKFFLLANFPVYVREAGLADEQHKTLRYYGIVVWEEGQTKVKFLGNTYEVIARFDDLII